MGVHRLLQRGVLLVIMAACVVLALAANSAQGSQPSTGLVVINEVAWGGTSASTSDEWIELYNGSDAVVDLAGWRLIGLDGSPEVALGGTLAPGAYFLLERTDDSTVSDVTADQIYSGALANGQEGLALWDAQGMLVDTANGNGGDWPAGSGSPSYRSMERDDPWSEDRDDNWHSNDGVVRNGLDAQGNPIAGTPRQANSPPPPAEPTATPGDDPTATPGPAPSETVQPTPSPGPTGTATPGDDPTSTPGPAPGETVRPTPSAGPTGTATPGDDPTVTPGPAPGETVQPTPSAGPTGTATPGDDPTATPSPTSPTLPEPTVTASTTTTSTLGPTPTAAPDLTPTPTGTATTYPDRISLNEFMPDPASDWNGDGVSTRQDEYVELHNANPYAVDLSGWLLDDVDDGDLGLEQSGNVRPGGMDAPQGSRPYRLPQDTIIAAQGFLVLFGSQTGIALNNDGDWVRLIRPDGHVLDQVEYERGRKDQAHSKVTEGGYQWTTDYAPSPGRANTPPGTATPTPPSSQAIQVFLNEFLPRPASDWNGDGRVDPGDEYVELVNTAGEDLDLGGWLLDDAEEASTAGQGPEGSRPFRFPDGTIIPAGGFLLFHRSQTAVALNDDGDSVRLLQPDGLEVERYDYDGSRPDQAHSKLEPGGNVWTGDYPPSPGAPNRPGYTPEDVVRLNELMPSPRDVDWDGDGETSYRDEWIELLNAGSTAVTLGGWKLRDGLPASGAEPGAVSGRTYVLPPGTTLDPGQFLVIYRQQSELALDPKDERVQLLYPDDLLADELVMRAFSGYDRPWCRLPDGNGRWTTDCLPTPGEANRAGPVRQPSHPSSDDPGPPYDRFNFDLVTVAQARSLPDGTRVTVEGQVTVLPGVFNARQAYLQDASGGLLVYLRSGEWPPLSEGQWVRVNGRLDSAKGEKEIRLTRIDDVKTLGPGIPPQPQPIRSGEVGESSEGRLVQLVAPVTRFWGSTTLYLDDGSGEAKVTIRESTGTRRPYVIVGDMWTVVGVVSQWDDDAAQDEGYRLLPRRASDLQRGELAWAAWNAPPVLLPVTGAAARPVAAEGWPVVVVALAAMLVASSACLGKLRRQG